MNARFNQDGSQVLSLRRRLPPVLYSTNSSSHLFQFNHSSYYNSCTMKSSSFAGTSDQFVMSGSDNFDIHVWKIGLEGSNRTLHMFFFAFCSHS
jgi:WD repeat-containing protein 22